MALFADYTTLTDIHTTRGTTATGQDALFTDLIKSTSRDMEVACGGRWFYPRIETRYYDTPGGRALDVEEDLLAITTLTNGDATAIASSDYILMPYFGPPYHQIRLKQSSSVVWTLDSSGNDERAITLLGIWGKVHDYASVWLDTLAILAAAITTTTATTFTCTTGIVKAGWLIRIDLEYLYVDSVSTGASDTVTVRRGVNGSTAATHVISSLIYRWYFPTVEMICRTAVQAYERLKDNPLGETIRIDGSSFSTPHDVKKWMSQQLAEAGLMRSH